LFLLLLQIKSFMVQMIWLNTFQVILQYKWIVYLILRYRVFHRLSIHCNTLLSIHCNTLQHDATHCNTLQHTATRCNTLQHAATRCNTLRHAAIHCNTLQHTATHCNTLQHTRYWVLYRLSIRISSAKNAQLVCVRVELQFVAVCHSELLQCVAACCSVLQCQWVAVCCS